MANAAQSTAELKGDLLSLKMLAAVPDCLVLTDAAITAADKTLTSAAAPFTAGSVGKVVCVNGAGTAGAALVTTIASFTAPDEVELTDAAATTVTGANGVFGTDNAAAFAALAGACADLGRSYLIRSGWYLTTATVEFVDGSIEVVGDARDNVASSVIVYVGTGVAVSIYPSDLDTQCFACNIKNLAIVCYGGASDALKVRNLSQAIFENVGINQSAGAAATNGLNLINPNLLTFKGTIAQRCDNAVIIDSTGFPWDATGVTFQGGNIYQNTTAFDFRANTVHVTVRDIHIEQFTKCFNLDKANANLQVERLIIEDNEILGGGGTFTDATLVSGAAPGITTLLCRRIEFSRNRCYFITNKENPINFDINGTATADVQVRLTDNVFSNVTTSLIAANSSGIEIIAEGNLRRFGSAFDLLSAGSTASLLVPVYGGQNITGAGRIPYAKAAGELTASDKLLFANDKVTISTDPADAQLEISDSAYSRVLRWFVGTSGYTAVVKFVGALGAWAFHGLTTLGSDEPPPCTVFVHNNETGGHTQLQVKGNAADGGGNALLNILNSAGAAALQILGDRNMVLPLLTSAKFLGVNGGGTVEAKTSVSLTADVTGTLPVTNGGTGQTTLAGYGGALLGDSTFLAALVLALATYYYTQTDVDNKLSTDYYDKTAINALLAGLQGQIDTLTSDVAALDSAISGLISSKADHGTTSTDSGHFHNI